MRWFLVILATLTVMVGAPATGAAQQGEVVGPDEATAREPEWVDAAELADLLVEKGLITPREQESLQHSRRAPSVDEETLERIFRRDAYRGDA
jgi:hypothetical protein